MSEPSSLSDWALTLPGVASVRHEPGWITLIARDGRQATVGCCWPDAPCKDHKMASPQRIADFKKVLLEFVNAEG